MISLIRDDSKKLIVKKFIIGVEGDEDEIKYFNIFKGNPNVQVISIPSEGKSSIKQIYEKVNYVRINKSYYDSIKNIELPLNDYDELWLVSDIDQNLEQGKKSYNFYSAIEGCKKNINTKKINLAISNECFEVWLLLHFDTVKKEELIVERKNLKSKFREELHNLNKETLYEKEKAIKYYLSPRIKNAIYRAKSLDNETNDYPDNPGTRVYKLIEEITKLDKRYF